MIKIFQFDLEAANISKSIDTVAVFDGLTSTRCPNNVSFNETWSRWKNYMFLAEMVQSICISSRIQTAKGKVAMRGKTTVREVTCLLQFDFS